MFFCELPKESKYITLMVGRQRKMFRWCLVKMKQIEGPGSHQVPRIKFPPPGREGC